MPTHSSIYLDITRKWDEVHEAGVMRYTLDDVLHKKDTNFIYFYNKNRFLKRRMPYVFHSLLDEFNDSLFNFRKVGAQEVLFQMNNELGEGELTVIVNVSPIVQHHILLVPNVNSCWNQVLRAPSVSMGLQFQWKMPPHIFLAYNSLLAHASVNHLHFHALPCEHLVYLRSQVASPIFPERDDVLTFAHHPLQPFVVTCHGEGDIQRASKIFQLIVDAHIETRVAHNVVFITADDGSVVNLILFPRKPDTQGKECVTVGKFALAALELSGVILTGHEDEFRTIQEQDVLTAMLSIKLEHKDRESLQSAVLRHLSESH